MSPITTVERTLELRIQDRGVIVPFPGTVEFTLAHSRFAAIPSWGGQIVRPTEGRTESQPYWVEVLDVDGAFTAILADNGRLAILGRQAELYLDTDGAGFTLVDTRRISAIEGGSEGVYRIELSDERWIERRTLLFERTTSWQLHPLGQAVDFMGRQALGQGQFFVAHVPDANEVVLVSLEEGVLGDNFVGENILPALFEDAREVIDTMTGGFTSLRFEDAALIDRPVLEFDATEEPGTPAPFATRVAEGPRPLGPRLSGKRLGTNAANRGQPAPPHWRDVYLWWPNHGLALGDLVTGRLYWSVGVNVTADTPYLIGGLDGIRAPDLYLEIAEGDHGGPAQRHDAAAFAALSGDIYPRAWYRIEEPKDRDRWVEDNLCKPYTVVPFVDGVGRLAPRSLRPPQDIDPETLYTFDLSTTVGLPAWRALGREAVTIVTFAAQFRVPFFNFTAPFKQRREHDTVALLGRKALGVEADAIFRWQDATGVFDGLKEDLFARYGDGPQRWDGLEGPIVDDAPEVGDLVVLDQDALKGPNLETGARTGKRVVHILERQRVYDGERGIYRYQILDAGPDSQPLGTPTVAIAQVAADPKHQVDITLTDVPAGATAIVQLAHGAAPAAADWFTVRTGVGNETIVVGNRPSGTQINARAIATAPNRIRSAYATVDSVTTASLTAPTSVTATATGRSVKVVRTGGETAYPVEFLIDGVPQLTLPAGSTQHTFHGLAASTQFTFGVRHRDPFGGISPTTTDDEVTGTALVAPAMAGLSARVVLVRTEGLEHPLLEDPDVTAVVTVLQLLAGDDAFPIVIERAPDDSGTPNEAARVTIARLPGTTSTYHDHRSLDGARVWYRAFHAREGWTDGAPTAWVSVTFSDVDGRDWIPPTVGDDDILRIRRPTLFDDGLYAAGGASDGHVADGISKYEGPTLHAFARHVETPTFGRDGDAKTFAQPYASAPTLALGALKVRTFDDAWTGERILRVFAQDVTTTGYTIVAQNVEPGVITARDDDFPAGNLLDAVAETTELALGDAPANDDAYLIHYRVELCAHAEENGPTVSITVQVAIDTDAPGDGSWVERKVTAYNASQAGWSGLDPGAHCELSAHEQHVINVSGLTAVSKIRLRIKSVPSSGETSFSVHGFNQPTDADPENGATYTTATDSVESATPNTEDGVQLVPVETA